MCSKLILVTRRVRLGANIKQPKCPFADEFPHVYCIFVNHCSIQDDDGFFICTLALNCFIDSSRASWLPEK